MELFNEIKAYYKELFNIKDDEYINKLTKNSISLSMLIAYFAHKNQKRRNNEDYIIHPLRLFNKYKDLIHINKDKIKLNNKEIETLNKSSISYQGIEEICLLHDVIEDNSITSLNLFNIFKINNLKEPLLLLTHNKNEDYSIYINKILKNKEASLVKLLDMYDNLNLLTAGIINNEYKEKNRIIFKIFIIN